LTMAEAHMGGVVAEGLRPAPSAEFGSARPAAFRRQGNGARLTPDSKDANPVLPHRTGFAWRLTNRRDLGRTWSRPVRGN